MRRSAPSARGKVTFSDRPPPDRAPRQAVPTAPASTPAAGLPIELRRVIGQYPVSLYTTSGCAPCDSGRSYLRQRGVPYTEHTISTREDFAALQRLSGASNLPFMTIGAQHLPGFSEAEWSQYFDAAGYPKTSQLPPSYRQLEPRPLVAVQQRAAPAERAAAPAPQPRAEATQAGPTQLGKPGGHPLLVRQCLHAGRGAQQAHRGLLLGEHAHFHHAGPQLHVPLEGERLAQLQAGDVEDVLAVVGDQWLAVLLPHPGDSAQRLELPHDALRRHGDFLHRQRKAPEQFHALDSSAMVTKRRDGAATIFSRVSRAPPLTM
jgi:glutaredoxin